jgi:hypothetical protein
MATLPTNWTMLTGAPALVTDLSSGGSELAADMKGLAAQYTSTSLSMPTMATMTASSSVVAPSGDGYGGYSKYTNAASLGVGFGPLLGRGVAAGVQSVGGLFNKPGLGVGGLPGMGGAPSGLGDLGKLSTGGGGLGGGGFGGGSIGSGITPPAPTAGALGGASSAGSSGGFAAGAAARGTMGGGMMPYAPMGAMGGAGAGGGDGSPRQVAAYVLQDDVEEIFGEPIHVTPPVIG